MNEIDRLRKVYSTYDQTPKFRLAWDQSNQGNSFILAERSSHVAQFLTKAHLLPFAGRRILDVGCGTGSVLFSMCELGARPSDLYGIDLMQSRIETARSLYPDLHLVCGDGASTNFPDGFFHLILAFTVFSSILATAVRKKLAAEITRILSRGGSVLWYDMRFDNPWNRNIRGVRIGALRELFPGMEVIASSTTLLPPLARCLGSFTARLYPLLVRIPLLRSHYIGLITKP